MNIKKNKTFEFRGFRGRLKSVFIISLLWVTLLNETFAQRNVECEKIVVETVEAINNKTPEHLEKYLAPDFTFSGQKPPLASLVLNQLVKQLNDEVADYQKISETENNGELTLVYEFTYAKNFGQRTTTFVFNKDNQIAQLDLFTIQVKTMSDETQVEKGTQEIITIPIQIRNKIPTTKATVNGESRTFIIDNGSPRLILNSKYLESKNDSARSISSVQGVNSSISNMDIVQMKDFDFYGIKIKESDVLAMDISHLEQELETEIYGLIGYEVYKDYDMLFDYANNTLTLIKPDATKSYLETNYKRRKIETLPIEMLGHIPTVKGKIGKLELNFGVDCGAGGNLLDYKFLNSLKKRVSMLENIDLAGAGETKNVQSGKIKNLTIGKKKFKNTLFVFNDMSHLNSAYNLQLDGLVGYEILSNQRILLSFQNRQLLFID